MHVADDSGTLREVTDMWVWDGSAWREVVDGWTANSDGTLQQWVNFGGEVVVTVTPIDHVSFRIGWTATDATQVALKVGGVTVYTATTPTGSWVVGGQTPTSTVSVSATATWAGGTTKDSATVQHTLANIPAPTGVGTGNWTSTTVDVSWAAVSGAADYQVCNADSGTVLTTTSQLTWTRTSLAPGTTYRMYVRARFNTSIVSVPSSTVTATTTASFPAGSYTFTATACDTKAANFASTWMVANGDDDVRHGYFSSNRGIQTAFFFGYKNASNVDLATFFSGGAPVNIHRVEVYVKRESDSHGSSVAQRNRFYRHQHVSKPALPSSAVTTGDPFENGTLLRGEAKWVDLPLAWGTDLVSGAVKGLCWGGTPYGANYLQYMQGPLLSTLSTMMAIRITTI